MTEEAFDCYWLLPALLIGALNGHKVQEAFKAAQTNTSIITCVFFFLPVCVLGWGFRCDCSLFCDRCVPPVSGAGLSVTDKSSSGQRTREEAVVRGLGAG